MQSKKDYGMLITPDIKLQRKYFNEMVKLHGLICKYRAPKPGKENDIHAELDTRYFPEIEVGAVLDQYPQQKSLRKMGWVAELAEGSMILHVPYDLPGLQQGALFTLPSAIEGAEGRTFRVLNLSNVMIYPASIACEIALEYQSTEEKSQFVDYSTTNFNLLKDDEEDD